METRLSNIFKTTNVTNLTKVIQESSYRVLQVTSKWKTLKQPVYFLKAVEYFGKSCKTTLFRKPTEVSQNTPTSYQYGHPLRNNGLLKIRKIFCWHLEFLMNQLFGQRFIIFEKVRCSGQLLLKLWAVEVATSFHWILSRST